MLAPTVMAATPASIRSSKDTVEFTGAVLVGSEKEPSRTITKSATVFGLLEGKRDGHYLETLRAVRRDMERRGRGDRDLS